MSSDDNYIRLHDYSYVSDSAAESLKDVTKGSNESSSSPVELLHTLLKTGTLEELARTILETTSSIRNTANEIRGIVRDLKEVGVIKKTANTVVETANTTPKRNS